MHQRVTDGPKQTWPVKCNRCNNTFDEYDWEKLDAVGVQYSGMDDYPDLEMRSCAGCRSTLSIVIINDFA